jgi:putative membrane protein
MKSNLSIFFKGMIMGVTELIPGVSGGTIALILGIYERLIRAISNINFTFLKGILSGSFKQSWSQSDTNFLFFLVFGMIVSVLSLSQSFFSFFIISLSFSKPSFLAFSSLLYFTNP